MAKYTSRGARVTALALVTGTLVAAATGSAGAAPVAVPDVFGGSARGTALHIEINLPAPVPLPAPLNGDILSLTQDISFTEGNATKGVAPVPVSIAKAVLGNGKTVVLGTDALSAINNLLAKSVTSSLDGQRSASDALLAQDLGIIKVGVGAIESSVAPEAGAATGLGSKASSSLVDLRVGLGGLTDSLPVDVLANLEQVTQTLEDVVASDGLLSTTIDGALQTINDATQGAAGPVVDAVQPIKDTLVGLLEQLTATLTDLSADTDLVRLGLLKSTEEIVRTGDAITATSTAEVGGLNILGGLVTVEAARTVSKSSANGRRGSAAADSDTTIAHVKVGDLLELDLGTDGLTGSLLGQQIPQTVKDAFQTVLTAVNGVLATAGVQIVNGKETSSVDPNGQFASSSSEGIGIVVNPLKAAKPLVLVQLVPAGTAVNAARVARRSAPVTPGRITNPGQNRSEPPLARTGAELPLFAFVGTGLALTALVVRRRRRIFEA